MFSHIGGIKTSLRRLRNELCGENGAESGGYLVPMTQDIIGAILSAGVLGYLVYALINPEKF